MTTQPTPQGRPAADRRTAVADLIMLRSYYQGREGTEMTSADRDCEEYLYAQDAADAILSLLDRAEAEVKADGLEEAAERYPLITRDMVSRGSVVTWLRDAAARLRVGEQPTCSTPGCPGDYRYAAPGRGHKATCHYGWNGEHVRASLAGDEQS